MCFYRYIGCQYMGITDAFEGFMNTNLPTLNFMETGSKKIRGRTIAQGIAANLITCEIKNNTSFLNSQGEWVALPLNISDILRISVEDGYGKIDRYLLLDWEKHADDFYFGLLIKLHVSCRTNVDHPYSGCFVFKSKGHKSLDSSSLMTSSLATTKIYSKTEKSGPSLKPTEPEGLPTVGSGTEIASTKKNVVNKNYTYNVSMPVIIGVSAGVGLVILIIIILAACFVRHRTRKQPEAKPSIVNTEAPPKVRFTAQTRFSLIQEAAPIDSDEEDYTSLKENRESYDPYCSLQKDDVDLNVIDTVLKDAVSMGKE
ncbi:Hypothetical predicted protein [Paramuricea clavata]|uniref:Uncharacterized protein n=1 Tax=Paramuricea clavata TaxID=317549 RepID=A0A7D9LYN1_PARCT|nr:Hypothetical predicted protein [Paramuricea clavata]